MQAVVQLQLRQMLGGKRIFLAALILFLPVLLALAARAAGGFADRVPDVNAEQVARAMDIGYLVFLFAMYPLFCAILLSLLYASSLVSQELEAKTLTYLFSRPLAKWRILGGQYLATALVITVGVMTSCTLGWLVCSTPQGSRGWIALMVSCVLGSFAYCALFCLIGLLAPRRAIPAGIVYAVLAEGLGSFVAAAINKLTISFHLRAIAYRITRLELPPDLRTIEELIMHESIPAGLASLCGITAAVLAAACYIITTRQFVVNEQA